MDLPTSRKLTTPWISGTFDDGILGEASRPGRWFRLVTIYLYPPFKKETRNLDIYFAADLDQRKK